MVGGMHDELGLHLASTSRVTLAGVTRLTPGNSG